MTATFGEVGVSPAVNPRPATIGIPSVSKKVTADGVVWLDSIRVRRQRRRPAP